MRLKRLQQVALFVLGAAALGAGITASMKQWGSARVIALIIPGLLLMVGAVVGVAPNMNLKAGSIEWPKPEEPKPVEPVAVAATQEPPQPDPAIEELRAELATVRQQFEDHILIEQGPPADDLTDEKRLIQFRDGLKELEHDVAMREYTGEDHDDGISTDELRKTREQAREYLRREERRQELTKPW